MFRYPGGKAKVSGDIYNALKERLNHSNAEFREPFIGGGAITKLYLKKKLTGQVWINDCDPGIASIWHCVINEPKELINIIEAYVPNINDYWQFKKDLTDPNIVASLTALELAFRKIVIHQFSYSGLGVKSGGPIGGKTQVDFDGQKKKYSFDCRWSPNNIVKEINKFYNSIYGMNIRYNTCTQLDYKELLLDTTIPAIIYLDPPYYEQGEALYQFSFTDEQHIEMAQILKETPHEWALSYDNHPKILELYSWARIISLDINYSITGANPSKEILITK